MDNEKLYSPGQWCFRRCDPKIAVQGHIETVTENSVKVRNEIGGRLNVKYGERPRQLLNVYEPADVELSLPLMIKKIEELLIFLHDMSRTHQGKPIFLSAKNK